MPHDGMKNQHDSSTRYRLAWGEVATPAIIAQRARLALLLTAETLAPEMRAEIEQKARECYFEFMAGFWDLAPELREWVCGYCRRWGLTEGREPAGWALDRIAQTLVRTCLLGKWTGWHLPAGAALGGGDYEPLAETLSRAKARTPRSRWPALRRAVEDAISAGAAQVRVRRNLKVVEWAVRHQILGETWVAIAEAEIGAYRSGDYADAVKMQARELLRLAGLSRPGGRRKRDGAAS